MNQYNPNCVECQNDWLASFVAGCNHSELNQAITAQQYCESCGVTPLLKDNERYCAACVDDILRWLWNEDEQYLMTVEVFEENYQYSREANSE